MDINPIRFYYPSVHLQKKNDQNYFYNLLENEQKKCINMAGFSFFESVKSGVKNEKFRLSLLI